MKVVILAGGSGTRLWPLSRSRFPKQFLKLKELNNYSLFQLTIKRALKLVDLKDIIIVTNKNYKFLVMGEIEGLGYDYDENNILCEPLSKNTLPAITYAMDYVDDYALILSSDHIIKNEDYFVQKIKENISLARNYLLTFGIIPNKIHTGYGYIKEGENNKVKEFKEKPDYETAKNYIHDGYLWNSGMFLFSKELFNSELEKYNSILFNLFKNSSNINDFFENVDNMSIDYGLLEVSQKVGVLSLDLDWSDLGDFDSIYDNFNKDNSNNVLGNDVININSKNNLVLNEDKKLIALCDIEDLVIIDTPDSLLISKKGSSQKVKEVVFTLKNKNDLRYKYHQQDYRPWGFYEVLQDFANYKVKKLSIFPNKSLSLQMHKYRSEHWIVVSGEAKVTLGEDELILQRDQSIYIPKETKHRLRNNSDTLLEIIEAQTGDYLGEDDIIRFEDEYGRK